MHNRLYRHQERKSFWVILGVMILLIIANVVMVFYVNPMNIFVEITELILLAALLLLLSAWVIGKRKWGLIVTGTIMYLLLLNRVGWMGWPSVGIGLVILGLISLIY